MGRKINPLYIGSQYLNIEGREIKHLALIKMFGTLNLNKTQDSPIELIGIDLETNSETAELKLLGFYDGKQYAHYEDDFLSILFTWIKHAYRENKAIAYWNKLDPFVLYKQFLSVMDEQDRIYSMSKFGKVSGEWDKELGVWEITPVCEIKIADMFFGIKNVIRSSIQFYFRREHDDDIKVVWAYDIASLYQHGLEKEATKRLKYYSKVDKSAHLVDWERFENDEYYKKNIVLKSNELDARAVHDLGYVIQEEFKEAFNFYPKTLISQGSLARSAIIATLSNIHGEDKEKINADASSIGIRGYLDKWVEVYGEELVKDFVSLMFEAYSGGQIEAYAYGYTKEAFTTDLTQAYPYHIQNLYDLRGATITHGKGTPPHIEYSYCLIRGDVDIPLGVDYHPLTIKHPIHAETNIRAVGEYRASYTLEERDFLVELGATFSNEEWYNIETTGHLSPLATVCKIFTDLRAKLKPSGRDYVAKISSASLYGILFEAVDTWVEREIEKEIEIKETDTFYKDILKRYRKSINMSSIKHHFSSKVISLWHNPQSRMYADMVKQEIEQYGIFIEHDHPIEVINEIDRLYRLNPKITHKETYKQMEVARDGYRGGEFLNPLYATIITSRTRLQVSRTLNDIKKKGGTPILAMTDSVFWKGTADMVNPDTIREIKTVGYYEKPQSISDMVCLGSGRYGYRNELGYNQAKKRGLNATELHDPDGVQFDEFDWMNAFSIMKKTNSEVIKVGVRVLVSVGMVLHNSKYTWKDLGKVVEEVRDVDVIVGRMKRVYDNLDDSTALSTGLLETEPIHISKGMFGDGKINDQTLPELRQMMASKRYETSKQIRNKNIVKANGKYREKIKDKHNANLKQVYDQLRAYGFNSKEANKMKSWSMDRIKIKLMEEMK